MAEEAADGSIGGDVEYLHDRIDQVAQMIVQDRQSLSRSYQYGKFVYFVLVFLTGLVVGNIVVSNL